MKDSPPAVSLEDQMTCIRREIAMRSRMYPHLVASGKMRHDVAQREMAALNAVLETLGRVQAGETFRRHGL